MIRFVGTLFMLAACSAAAEVPNFSGGGFTLKVQYGPGFWTIPTAQLGSDPGTNGYTVGQATAEAFAKSLQSSHTVSLGAAYTILGHASIGADLTATGWNLADDSRGGGGMVVGKVAWHPLELVFLNKEKRPIGLDVNTFFGVGYGIVGGATSIPGQPGGMDGLLFEWGFDADYFFTRYIGLGAFVRGVFLNWDKYYFDYNNRDVAGNTVALAKPLGGSFWTFGITLSFRAGD